MGGVQNYYKQLFLNVDKDIFDVLWIFTKNEDEQHVQPLGLPVSENIVVFTYNSTTHPVYKELFDLIDDRPGLIMTNFHFELEGLRRFKKRNKTIVHVCHDDFFLDIAWDFCDIIDYFIAHNIYYYNRLNELFSSRREDVFYLPYGIPIPKVSKQINRNMPLSLLFLARLEKKKGVYDLFEIDSILKLKGLFVRWTLIGDGPEKGKLQQLADDRSNFDIVTLPDSDSIQAELVKHDLFVLPSYLDGLPLALLETMSVGLVPVISEFNKGISSVVKPDIGFVLPVGDNIAFADTISFIDQNREKLEKYAIKTRALVSEMFDVSKRIRDYNFFFEAKVGVVRSDWLKFESKFGRRYLQYFKKKIKEIVGKND